MISQSRTAYHTPSGFSGGRFMHLGKMAKNTNNAHKKVPRRQKASGKRVLWDKDMSLTLAGQLDKL